MSSLVKPLKDKVLDFVKTRDLPPRLKEELGNVLHLCPAGNSMAPYLKALDAVTAKWEAEEEETEDARTGADLFLYLITD